MALQFLKNFLKDGLNVSFQYICLIFTLSILLNNLGTILSHAQVVSIITPDTTLPINSVIQPNGNVLDITAGTTVGSNLFHSFQEFNVGEGDVANFVDSGGVTNILSRVTGANPSNIFGQLRSEATANLYFLNPNGVVFGPNASLDVGGSFYVSTANYIGLGDSPGAGLFSAMDPGNDVLTSAPPTAFGFLGEFSSKITIDQSNLSVREGETLSVIGGDIEVKGNDLEFLSAMVNAPGGTVEFGSIQSPGEVILNLAGSTPHIDVSNFDKLGRITVGGGARVSASGNGGGTVVIRGGQFVVDAGLVLADTEGNQDGASVGLDVQVTGRVDVTNLSTLSTDVLGNGDGGALHLTADEIHVLGNATVASRAFSEGNAGRIAIRASKEISLEGSNTSILSQTSGSGNAGTLSVEASNVIVAEGATLTSLATGPGNAAAVTVNATDTVAVSGTSPEGTPSFITALTVGEHENSGDTGTVHVEASTVTVVDGGAISTLTGGAGEMLER